MQINDSVYHILLWSEYHHQICRSPREAARVLGVGQGEIHEAIKQKTKIRDLRVKYIRLDYSKT